MKTKIPDIVSYWMDKKDDSSLGMEWKDAHERCWRCGHKSRLERCHIIPKSIGGGDDPFNLILLCNKCHKEAPNINDSNFIWEWIESDHGGIYDTYWTFRAFVEFEKVFGRKPFSVGKFKKVKNISKIIEKKMKAAIVHYGESGFNTSTLTYIIKSLEDELSLIATNTIKEDPINNISIKIQTIIAEVERDTLIDKLRDARISGKEDKGYCEGRKPFGHRDGEAATLDLMRLLRRKPKGAKCMSFAAIADKLNQDGIKTRTGKPWYPEVVRRLLIRGQ